MRTTRIWGASIAGARCRDHGSVGLAAMHFAAREGQMDAVRALVKVGADVNARATTDETTPMTTAIINGYFDIGKFLLDNGADPNLANTGGLAPLFATIDQGWAARTWYPGASSEQETVSYLGTDESTPGEGSGPERENGPQTLVQDIPRRLGGPGWRDAVLAGRTVE